MSQLIKDRDKILQAPEQKHKIVIDKYDGFSAEIDELIAPLILELWKAENPICQFCQDHPVGSGFFRLQFDEQQAMECFLNMEALFVGDPDDFRARMQSYYGSRQAANPNHWRYEILSLQFCGGTEFELGSR